MPNSTYLSVEEAARKYAVEEKVMTQLIAAGMIETPETPTGDVFVVAEKNGNSQKPQTKEEIIADEFAHLCGQTISASEASRRYSDEQIRISIPQGSAIGQKLAILPRNLTVTDCSWMKLMWHIVQRFTERNLLNMMVD